ncbi:putative ribonuclease H-like domain-containing protein [Tanacetum coccineum]|uniref:Ribonuclease H-like domain-containing protein n=1 Tax=Tanacetum coccineum TaxID=301880 RepID=A0ABQ5DDN7_9ASTR
MATTITYKHKHLYNTAAATTVIAVSTRPIAKGLVIHKQESKHLHQQFLHNNHHRSRTELVEESSKKAEAEIAHEINDGDDVTIDPTPLSTKSPTIVDYKIYIEGKKSYFQIMRADGKTQMYLTFGKMLKNFDREDLETMFEHHVEDNVWKNQQGLVKVLNWKLYDSCGVHCVTMQNMLFYLLVEKMYPLTNHTLYQMFNDVRLQIDYECEMAFELLRLGRIVGIKSLLEVTAAKLMLLVYKLLLLVLNFQDSIDDEEDTRSSQEYLKDLEEEYQARAFLAKSKSFFKKGTQRLSSIKATGQTECHKCCKKGHFARDCWLKTLVPSYQSPFQPKPLSSSHHKPELRPTKDFEAKYNKFKAKLALLSSNASASNALMVKNKGLIAEAYE